jgi:extradiol dioxygenase family protein
MSERDKSSDLAPFHLAVAVDDLAAARAFYGGVLGFPEGRSNDRWVDWNVFGHQVVTHLVEKPRPDVDSNPVDGHDVPVPHFGVVLSVEDFHDLAGRVKASGIQFIIEPYLRFAGEPAEQWTMFFTDPAGNPMEFKAFRDRGQLFNPNL